MKLDGTYRLCVLAYPTLSAYRAAHILCFLSIFKFYRNCGFPLSLNTWGQTEGRGSLVIMQLWL